MRRQKGDWDGDSGSEKEDGVAGGIKTINR